MGIYQYNGKEKIVCACEDFTDSENRLYEFKNLALSTTPDRKIDTEIEDIMKVLDENSHIFDVKEVTEKFWDMFIVDGFIGNTNRHHGDWGFLLNKNSKKATFSPIYDCGSSLNPLLTDEEINNMDDSEKKNIVLNTHSCFKENGKKINYINYIKSLKNRECNNALLKIFPLIDINKIMKFIDDIECISKVRKEFYKEILNRRYLILKECYQELKQ